MKDFWNNGSWHRARKQYECRHCDRDIAIGDLYWADYNCANDPYHPHRFCANCVLDPESGEYGLVDPETYPPYIASSKGGR